MAIRSWKGLNQFYQKVGFKNPLVPTVVTLFLFLLFINGLPRQIERFVDHVVTSIRQSTIPVTPANPAPASIPPAQAAAPAQVPVLSANSSGEASAKPEASAKSDEKAPMVTKSEDKATSNSPVSQVASESEAKNGTDALKALGDGVKDVSHAVNTADQGAQAVDTAKRLIGF